jgi:hypothetical protein
MMNSTFSPISNVSLNRKPIPARRSLTNGLAPNPKAALNKPRIHISVLAGINNDNEIIPAMRNTRKLIRLPISTCNFRVLSLEGLRLLGANRVSVNILRTKKPVIQEMTHARKKNPMINMIVVVSGIEKERVLNGVFIILILNVH